VGQLIINTVTMRENNSYLPDEEDPSRILNAQGTVRTINVRLKDLKNFPNGKIVIGIKNVNSVPLNIGIQLDLDYPSNIQLL